MPLTFITGPMKSGKSLELISMVAPHQFAEKTILYVQPADNTRDDGIVSRLGVNTKAVSVSSLSEVQDEFDVVGIDEIHMFQPGDIQAIERWVRDGKHVYVSGLDLDYRGSMPEIVIKLLELKPEQIVTKVAVCEICKQYTAGYSQIIKNGEPVLEGLPLITPEDGTYEYQARCRDCFKKLG